MKNNSVFDHMQIIKYYTWSQSHPLKLSHFAETIGMTYLEIVENLISSMLPEKMNFLFGYYLSDIRITIKQIDSLYKDVAQKKDILICNVLLFEFLYDLLYWGKYPDNNHFFEVYRKYFHLIVEDTRTEFLNLIDDAGKKESQRKLDVQVMKGVLVAICFASFHEIAHKNQSITNSIYKIFRETGNLSKHIASLNDKQIEECACDYFALYSLLSPEHGIWSSIKEPIACSATEVLTYAHIMYYADNLFQTLKTGVQIGYKNNIADISHDIMINLQTRFAPLLIALKITSNIEGMSMEEADWKKASHDSGQLVKGFYGCLVDVIQKIIKKFAEIPELQSTGLALNLKQPVTGEDIWYTVI